MTLLSALNACLNNYIENGKRSNTRVISLHQYIGSFLKNPEYEKTLQGLFNKKNVDIYELSTNTSYEIKLILGNYKQNINNYIENMIGATTNLKAFNINVCQIIFIPQYLPYFNNEGILKKIEYISPKNIIPYKNIMASNLENKPSELIYQLFDTGNLSFLQDNINKKIILNDLKMSYNISLIKSIDNTINDFLHMYSFNKFIDKRK